MSRCQNCDADLTIDPRRAVEDDMLDEVVAHIRDGDESFVVSETDHYCDAECFMEAVGDE